MKIKAGLWIDHKKAVMVFITGDKEKKLTLESGIDRIIQPAGKNKAVDSRGRYDLPKYDIDERYEINHINSYLDNVADYLCEAEALYIFGPGQAKIELAKRIEKNCYKGKISKVENADKMTDRQISAKVKKYFKAANRMS